MKPIGDVVDLLFDIGGSFVYHKDSETLVFRISNIGVVLTTVKGWDHLIVSVKGRTPTYQEMKLIKRLCFRDDEWAYEVHPAVDDYISVHHNALHIWRPHDGVWREPPLEVFVNPMDIPES